MGWVCYVDFFVQLDEEDVWWVEQVLVQLGIVVLVEDDFGVFFGGQQQLVLIVCVLVSVSQNILLDELCLVLDFGNQQVVLQLIGDFVYCQVCIVLFIIYDFNYVLQVVSYMLFLLLEGWWLVGEIVDVLSEMYFW